MSRDGAGRKREGHDGLVVIMIADSSRRKKRFRQDRTARDGTKKNACSVNVKQSKVKQKKKKSPRPKGKNLQP